MSENNISGDFMTKKRIKQIIRVLSVVLIVSIIITIACIMVNHIKTENEHTDLFITEISSTTENSTKTEGIDRTQNPMYNETVCRKQMTEC